jgi:hypothetical protein
MLQRANVPAARAGGQRRWNLKTLNLGTNGRQKSDRRRLIANSPAVSVWPCSSVKFSPMKSSIFKMASDQLTVVFGHYEATDFCTGVRMAFVLVPPRFLRHRLNP